MNTPNQPHTEKNKRLLKVAITHGDPNGIGYEIILKTFAENSTMLHLCTPIVYGGKKLVEQHLKALQLRVDIHYIQQASEAKEGKLNFVCCTHDNYTINFGKVDPEAGKLALEALDRATEDVHNGCADVLVTAPINKAAIQSEQFHFPGHTEYLESRWGSDHGALMILQNELMRIALATTHVPVKAISSSLTAETVELKIRQLQYALCHDYLISMPRIAVLALNPHCGDHGTIGEEEDTLLQPIIQQLLEEGKHVYGPYSADGFFGSGLFRKFDGILAMYHDQGLAPFKALSMEDGVNYTAGLNHIRTSPDHGTAFDIAGKGLACPQSLQAAIFTAIDLYRNRCFDDKCHENPLPKLYREMKEECDKGPKEKKNFKPNAKGKSKENE